jgi:adenylosuccinate lyase
MFGGAAGTLASVGEIGIEIQERMAAQLSLRPMPLPARTIGDHLAEYVTLLGLLASTCSKIGREIYELMKPEFGEVEEPVPPGTVGSSTMPQKRNPKLCQDIVAAAAELRALVPLALESMQTEHEADRTTSLMIGRALSEACIMTGEILVRLDALFAGLQIFPERMRRNLDLSGGLIMAEAVMLELGRRLGRQRAHDLVYEAAQTAATSGRPFRDLLLEDVIVRGQLSPAEIDALLDPVRYTGASATFARRAAATGRELAASLRARQPAPAR